MTAVAPEFLNKLYSKDFVKTSRTLRRLKTYNGVKVSLEMVLTYDLIASFNRDQRMANGHVKQGMPSAFGQAELADFLMCSIKTAGRTIAAMKKAGMIECVGRGPHDVDLLVCLPIAEANTEEAAPTPKPSATRPQRAATAPEEVQESNHTAEPIEAPEVVEVVPIPAAPGEQPTDLIRLYTSKVETAEQQTGQAVPIAPAVTLYLRGEIKEPSRDWDLDPAF
ncbi:MULTISPECIES: hypothetical protein [Enterobacteriaceae]|uniref:hypothetical protein n=1 Tax=Enterobacteriaceae TaxID=543 RepID=UPI000CFD3A7D|nr:MULTISPECIES: hypothetical protein [Enterobacteriaceae]MCQ6981800.1 hypothetical protein [Escherichia coli]MCQ7040407.1 hypothetical protein [Escherichia coli]HAO1539694.1 hypothetical protein [Escherichia coli]HAO1544236.1 hypothetical protein [Escherichia coli]